MATVLFFIFLPFKKLRRNNCLMAVLLSVAIFSFNFILAQSGYVNASNGNMQREIKGIICQTPYSSDYSNSYVIKVLGENYKIRYVSEYDKGFKQGEKVSGRVILQENKDNTDYFENALSSKIYFNCFEGDDCLIATTGEKDFIYYYAGELKAWFVETISQKLSGENNAIAKAMSIGDRSGLSDKITTNFNYSGISHLLVVSGLHLSLWSLGIMKIMQKSEKTRRFMVPVGLFCLVGFIILTGLSVSVIRAGFMVGFVLISKAIKRHSDSLNSIGFAVTLIILTNPFSPYSASLWLSVLSTTGILVFYEPIRKWMSDFRVLKKLTRNPIFNFILTSVAISISTAISTMPVFIIKFNMMPIASVITNFLAVNIGLILMVSTVFGVFAHLLGLSLIADFLFFVVGVCGTFLQRVAEEIGSWRYSTISVASPIFKYFLLFSIFALIMAYVFKKHNIIVFKGVATMLSVLLVLVTLFTVSDDYNTMSVYIDNRAENTVAVVNFKGDTVLFGNPDKKQIRNIRNMMTRHNAKSINGFESFSEEARVVAAEFVFADENASGYKFNKLECGTEIIYKNVNLLLINNFPYENHFKKDIKYDIIILNMPIEDEFLWLNGLLRNENSLLLCVQKDEAVSIDCKREKFYATYN